MIGYVEIYKKILKPAGIKYYVYGSEEKGIKDCSPKKQWGYWTLVYPQEIIDIFGLSESKTDVFSGMSLGNFDRVNKSSIGELKTRIIGTNTVISEIYNHILKLIEQNSVIETIIKESKSKNSLTIGKEKLEKISKTNTDKIEKIKTDIKNKLKEYLIFYKDEICEDKRFDQKLKEDFIDKNIESDPIKVVGFLCVYALFDEKEQDKIFLENLSLKFLEERADGIGESSKLVECFEHDLTDHSICLSKNQVLFRDKEIDEIIRKIKDKNTRGLALSGMGGCGKTSIAGVIYGLLKNEFDYCGWINYVGNLKESMIRQINIGEYSNDSMTEKDIEQKWSYINSKIKDNKKSKLFIIDNVDYIEGIQSPLDDDKELLNIIGRDNVKIVLTTRFSEIEGYEIVKIDNLGDESNYDNCVELFYHYNDKALNNRDTNIESVRKLCQIASYNTMVIELLAKASRHSDCTTLEEFTDELLEEGFNYVDDVIVKSLHDNNEIHTRNEDGSIDKEYYNKNKETGASQLIKLFNLKTRSSLEKQILWDFHCLPEAERVSKEELNNWMGYSSVDVQPLIDESWIKDDENGFYYMHPLIKQAIVCVETESDWEGYWNQKEEREQQDIISEINDKTLFLETDSFELGIRKIYFAYYLSYFGKFLKPEELLYIADAARNRGVRKIGISLYERAFHILHEDEFCKKFINYPITENIVNEYININKEQLDILVLYWKSAYYLAYMLSFTKSGLNAAEETISFAAEICKRLSWIALVLCIIDGEVSDIDFELSDIEINSELLQIEYESSENEYEIVNLNNKTLKCYIDKVKDMILDSALWGMGNNVFYCYLKKLSDTLLNGYDSEDFKNDLFENYELYKINAMTDDHFGYIISNNLNSRSYSFGIFRASMNYFSAFRSRISVIEKDIRDIIEKKPLKVRDSIMQYTIDTHLFFPWDDDVKIGKYDSFFANFHEFLEKYDIYSELIQQESMRGLAWTCDNIGAFYANINLSTFNNDWKKIIERLENNSEAINQYNCLIEGEKHAELLLEEALRIRKAQNILTEVAWTECNLAMLLSKRDNIEKAKEHVESAIEIYKELEIEYPEQHISSLARAYKIYVNILKKDCSINQDTLEIYNEVMEIYQKLEQDSPGLYKDEIEDLKLQIIDAQKLINS